MSVLRCSFPSGRGWCECTDFPVYNLVLLDDNVVPLRSLSVFGGDVVDMRSQVSDVLEEG